MCQSAPIPAKARQTTPPSAPAQNEPTPHFFSVSLHLCALCVIPTAQQGATPRHKKPHSRAPAQNEPPPTPLRALRALRGSPSHPLTQDNICHAHALS